MPINQFGGFVTEYHIWLKLAIIRGDVLVCFVAASIHKIKTYMQMSRKCSNHRPFRTLGQFPLILKVYSAYKSFKTKFMITSCEIAFRRMPQNTFHDKLTLVQLMAWCRQASGIKPLSVPVLTQIYSTSLDYNGWACIKYSAWILSF